ncbi:hypothetical protein A9Q90_09470 [Gammaproteobacteria bacterium 54_18_T64]|nr:hypothetical protein A9Q90_09470 [Gammaproteobacteria bacterium 54_18_T64]
MNMSDKLTVTTQPPGLAAFIATACLCGTPAFALEAFDPTYTFNGFGTLGAIYSDEGKADYVSSWLLQPNGAGHTSEWHGGIDSKLGGQVNIEFSEAFSAVVQVVVQRQEDNAWTPELEWANVQYRFNDQFSLRLGRTVLPSFMVSDTRLVGYANPWIRPPQELYQLNPLTNLDGLDLAYAREFDNARNTLHLSFGQTDRDVVQNGQVRARNGLVISNTFEYKFATLRLMYMRAKLDLGIEQTDIIYGAYTSLGETLSTIPGQENNAATAMSLGTRYDIADNAVELYSAGIKLEPGNWLLMGEWGQVPETGALANVWAGYATLGYHFPTFMPFITLAEINGDTPNEPGVATTGMPASLAGEIDALNQGLNLLLFQASTAQKSITAGLRWDCYPGTAIKLQYQHIEIDDHSPGRLGNIQPDFTPGGTVNVFSAVIDFVF